jgi:MFS family permease
MTAANGNLNMIYAGRAVAGLGIGASSLTVPVYIAETAPPSIRGRLVGIFEIASQGGGMLGFWINYGTDQHISSNSVAQYVIPLALQLAPGLLLGVGMFFICPESPRWLARQDNFEAAEKVLCDLRGLPGDHEYVLREMGEIRQQVEERSTLKMTKKEQFMKLFQKGTRNRMAIGLALMFLQSFTGVVSVSVPSIFDRNYLIRLSRTLSPTTPLASLRLLVLQEPLPSSSLLDSMVLRRPWECAHSHSTLLRKSAAGRACSGALPLAVFPCCTSADTYRK